MKLPAVFVSMWALRQAGVVAGFRVRAAQPGDRAALRRLDDEIYAHELAQQPSKPDEDPGWISETRVRVLEVGGQPAGMYGITPPEFPFSTERMLTATGRARLEPVRSCCIEVRRVGISHDLRSRGASYSLGADMALQALGLRCRHLVISGVAGQRAFYERLGWRAFDRDFSKGACCYTPMILDLEAFSLRIPFTRMTRFHSHQGERSEKIHCAVRLLFRGMQPQPARRAASQQSLHGGPESEPSHRCSRGYGDGTQGG